MLIQFFQSAKCVFCEEALIAWKEFAENCVGSKE